MEKIYYTQFSIKENSIVLYPRSLNGNRKFNFIHYDEDVSGKKTYKGSLTTNSSKLIYKRIYLFQRCIDFYNEMWLSGQRDVTKTLKLITLTLSDSQAHSDQLIKQRLLKEFLNTMKTKYNMRNYIWKAERQKNGNIHFHIVTDLWIHYRYVQDEWNAIQEQYGYLKTYKAIHGHTCAPSTEIKKAKNPQKTVRYMAKYMCKNDENEKIDGCVWRCSNSLLQLVDYTSVLDNELQALLESYRKTGFVNFFENDHCKIFQFPFPVCPSLLTSHYSQEMSDFISKQCDILFNDSSDEPEEILPETIFLDKLFAPFPHQLELFGDDYYVDSSKTDELRQKLRDQS